MWLRSLVAFLTLTVMSFFAGNRQMLLERYGKPIATNYVARPGVAFSETYLVRPGVVVLVQYGSSGQPCVMLLRPEQALHPLNNRTNMVGDYKEAKQMLSEIVPDEERGKFVSSAALHLACGSDQPPDLDCGGAEDRYEKVIIHHSGGRDTEHFATVVWTRDECKNTKPQTD